TRPSSDDDCGASTPTRPVGSGTVNEKYGPATGFAAPRTLATLSVQPAYHTHLSIEASTTDDASAAEMPSHADTSAANWARRPSSISATPYSTGPRLYAVAPDHPPNAFRAADTASRTSLREAREALARKAPEASVTGYVRPD